MFLNHSKFICGWTILPLARSTAHHSSSPLTSGAVESPVQGCGLGAEMSFLSVGSLHPRWKCHPSLWSLLTQQSADISQWLHSVVPQCGTVCHPFITTASDWRRSCGSWNLVFLAIWCCCGISVIPSRNVITYLLTYLLLLSGFSVWTDGLSDCCCHV